MKLTQAILPVAGLGTRFLPWTKVVPKELLPLGRMPIIALLVDECLSVGIREICFVISPGKELIPAFFVRDPKLEEELQRRGKIDLLQELTRYDEVRFTTVYQQQQLGDGHAILQAAPWVTSEHVAILFGDDLIIAQESGGALKRGERGEPLLQGLQQLVQNYKGGAILCLQDVPRAEVSRYGIAEVEPSAQRLKRICNLVEKPAPEVAPSTLAVVGKYIIPRSLFATLGELGRSPVPERSDWYGAKEIRLIDALVAAPPTLPLYGYVFEGRRFDVGTPEGYREAVAALG